MPLQISAFRGTPASTFTGSPLQVAHGAPEAVSASSFTGSYTVPDGCSLIKINGTGTIAWPGVATPEAFDGMEWRGVNPGQQFTVA